MVATPDRYDTIGRSYGATRRADPRYAEAIHAALGSASSVLNVGAGTGSYEPRDRAVVALEPSAVMIAQRPTNAAPCVRGVSENLPFADRSFDAIMGVLTVHHWTRPLEGLAEVRRVTRGPIVIVATSVQAWARSWLAHDYFHDALTYADEIEAEAIAEAIDGRVEPLLTPSDCIDGFMLSAWRRPEAYLDPAVRAGISWFATIGPERERIFVERLGADLASGAWHERHGHILSLDRYDGGHRLIIA